MSLSEVGQFPVRRLPILLRRAQWKRQQVRSFYSTPASLASSSPDTSAGCASNNADSEEAVRRLLEGATVGDKGDAFAADIDPWKTSPYNSPDSSAGVGRKEERGDPFESIFLFPGQGAQFLGMGKKLVDEIPAAKRLFEEASSVLRYDLLKLCLQGPKQTLDRTEYCQPAVYVCSLAALEKAKLEYPEYVKGCVATAGFSVGEFSALVFANSMDFKTGLSLIQARGQLMQRASETQPSGLVTVMERAASDFAAVKRDVEKLRLGYVAVANFLFPECKVVGGTEEALQYLIENREKYHFGPMKRLPVSGAFHTALMKDAADEFMNRHLSRVTFMTPRIPVFANVDSDIYPITSVPIAQHLHQQMYRAVRWEQILSKITRFTTLKKGDTRRTFPSYFEVGPGRQLTQMMNRMNRLAVKHMKQIEC